MTRIASALITFALALASHSMSMVHGQQPTSAPRPSTCIIATPRTALRQGEAYRIIFYGCHGSGPIQLRYGNTMNLATDKVPACVTMNLAKGSCIFTPPRPGTGFSFSTISASGKETFSGTFAVVSAGAVTAPVAADVPHSSAGGSYPAIVQGNGVTDPKSSVGTGYRSQSKAVVHKAKLATEAIGKRRALYDMTGYVAL
ncbi:hypothetical protein BGZ51_000820 [Haplosporangium sp. Z 767]|nr:hypothetical protein BGZ51_000820 [Haplosporangium sp. Z 767]KAF9189582.1 hypothetical protein BGZ50_000682 [Haplosporangium sp. Z 11]